MVAILSLGSCLGDSAAIISRASDLVAALPLTREIARSSLYETEAVDVPREYSGILFINSAIAVDTGLDPADFSNAIHEIESRLGRVRTGTRHEPRIIDIDIVAFGDITSDDPTLTLPHPEAAKRRFVLAPLAEMLPDFILPGQSATAAALLAELPEHPGARKIGL